VEVTNHEATFGHQIIAKYVLWIQKDGWSKWFFTWKASQSKETEPLPGFEWAGGAAVGGEYFIDAHQIATETIYGKRFMTESAL